MENFNRDNTLISILLSFRNEEEVIPELITRLQKVFSSFGTRYELIFINDASTDHSLNVLMEKAKHDPSIKIINMSARFGVSECILAGMRFAKGDAVIMMDCDLQDPPETIPEMIEKWTAGADVVYTVRESREGETLFKIILTRLAYRCIRFF